MKRKIKERGRMREGVNRLRDEEEKKGEVLG